MGFAIAFGVCGAGCYTDPVNMRPTIRIDTPEPLYIGKPLTYTATASDPDDGEPPTITWLTVDGACAPGHEDFANWPAPDLGWEPSLTVDLMPRADATTSVSSFCVWAKAVDRQGAASVDALTQDPQDHPPVAMLELAQPVGGASFPIGTMFILSAEHSVDVDQPVTTLAATMRFKASPSTRATLMPCSNPGGTAIAGLPETFVQCFTADVAGDYEVQLVITDAAKVVDTVDKTLHVDRSQPPVAVVDLEQPMGPGPYGLGQIFRVSSVNSKGDDGAKLMPVWAPLATQAGSGSTATLTDCGDAPYEQCFVPDVPGTYHVGLVVHGSGGDSAPVDLPIVVVGDQPPCLDKTTPDFTAPTMDTEFSVDKVTDDLDPVPSMQWFVSKNGGDFQLARSSSPTFSLNKAAFSLGDFARVRLEIRDRDVDRANQEFLACTTDTCTLNSLIHTDTCFQRVTWTVSFR